MRISGRVEVPNGNSQRALLNLHCTLRCVQCARCGCSTQRPQRDVGEKIACLGENMRISSVCLCSSAARVTAQYRDGNRGSACVARSYRLGFNNFQQLLDCRAVVLRCRDAMLQRRIGAELRERRQHQVLLGGCSSERRELTQECGCCAERFVAVSEKHPRVQCAEDGVREQHEPPCASYYSTVTVCQLEPRSLSFFVC